LNYWLVKDLRPDALTSGFFVGCVKLDCGEVSAAQQCAEQGEVMKNKLVPSGAMAFVLSTAGLFAQDSSTNLTPILPGGADVRTNSSSLGAPGIGDALIIGGATNAPAKTNDLSPGAPGSNNGLDSGERKGQRSEPRIGPGQAPSVGSAPSVGTAPSVGHAPSPGTAPKIR
jgi:hypothetical protein